MKWFWLISAVLWCLPVLGARAEVDENLFGWRALEENTVDAVQFTEGYKKLSQEDKNLVGRRIVSMCSYRRFLPELLKIALQNGFDVNAENEKGQTPLLELPDGDYGKYECAETAKILIENGAELNVSDEDGETPLVKAVSFFENIDSNNNSQSRYWQLRRMKIDPIRRNEMFASSMRNKTAIRRVHNLVKFMIEHGADVNLGIDRRHGNNALFEAALQGDYGIVKLLVENGADIDAKYGETLLIAAICYNNTKYGVVELLLEHGANPNAKLWGMYSALGLALSNRHPKVAELLLKNGAEVNTNYGYESLLGHFVHFPFYRVRDSFVKLLLKYGADVNITDRYGEKPIHISVKYNIYSTTKILLEHGADVNAKTEKGKTPLQIAKEKGHDKIVELLRQYGAKE